MIVDIGDALAELARLAEPTVCPTLTDEEQLLILDRHQRGYLWVASTAIELGAIIIPTLTNRSGHRYRLMEYTAAGTDQKTGTTEPIWSDSRDCRITDNHVVWQEDGFDWNGTLWDLTAAAREAWLAKAAKASITADTVRGELQIKSSQLYDHCIKQASMYQPVYCL